MKLKILQWNIWYKENPKKIADEIVRLNPDIVCAQELKQDLRLGINFSNTISEITKYNFFYKESATWDNRQDISSQGNAIFSRFPIVKTDFVFLSKFKHNPSKATEEGRVYVETSIKLDAKLLTVGTTHLSYSNRFINTIQRKVEAGNLVSLLKNKKDSFVFTGDLNAIPGSYVVNKITDCKNLRSFGPDLDEKTWPTKPFNHHGFKENKLNWRIDYVFGTRDIEVISSKIVKTKVSDHLPILVEIEV